MGSKEELRILYALENLSTIEFKLFKDKLCDINFERRPNIPRGTLERADRLETRNLLVDFYSIDKAISVTIRAFNHANLREAAFNLKEEIDIEPINIHAVQYLCSSRVEESKRKYKEYIITKFRVMKDANIRIGECVTLSERYTNLLISKKYREEAEKKKEIMFSGGRHLELMTRRAEHSYSSIEALFDPEEDGHIPSTLVLQGAPGIGKTMTAQKIMLDWAMGDLFQDRFDYAFYIHCRENSVVSGQKTIADLILHSCAGQRILSMREIEEAPKKLLFIIDGFDDLNISRDLLVEDSGRMSREGKTLISLIRKKYLLGSYVMITTRPTSVETLMQCLRGYVMDERFGEILGFSEEDRKKYFTNFFGNETEAAQAFDSVKENEILFTMCFVPTICWIVCTVIEEQMAKNEDFVKYPITTTSVFMLFLSNLLKQQSGDSVQPIINQNLKRLCTLAKNGIYQRKVLFDERVIAEYGLDIPAIESLLLNSYLFQEMCENYKMYSFIHLSIQEFFAALFYVLGENEAATEHTHNPQRDVMQLLKDYRENNHLMLTVRFLFGLLNNQRLDQMEKIFPRKISSDIKPALHMWIKEELGQGDVEMSAHQMDLIHCLYEIQDDEFVKIATGHLEDIKLSSESMQRKMTAVDFRALAFCLKSAPGVQGVQFYDCEIKSEDLGALTTGLLKCSRLRMEKCSLTGSHCADLSSVLRRNTSLTELDLSNNKLEDFGVKELCEGFKHPDCRIQKLRMEKCSLTGSCCADVASVLRTNTSLTELDLSYNKLEDSGVRGLCEGLKHPYCRLQKLRLDTCSLAGSCCAALSSVLRTNTSLTKLLLSNNKLGDSGARELCEGLKHPCCKIQTLWIDECAITGSCCAGLASVLRTNTSLLEFKLGKNKLGDNGVRELCEGLKHPDFKIQTLWMEHCSLTGSCCADLSSVLRTITSLTELELSNNELGDSGVRELCEGLKHPDCKIQKLSMGSCLLTGSCCADLASVLRTNITITELNLNNSELGDSGVRELCEGLKHPGCKIKTLRLEQAGLTDGCTEALCSALGINHSLQQLDLFENRFTMRSSASFDALKKNHPTLELRLKLAAIPDDCTANVGSAVRAKHSLQHQDWYEKRFLRRSMSSFSTRKETRTDMERRHELAFFEDSCTEALDPAFRRNQSLQLRSPSPCLHGEGLVKGTKDTEVHNCHQENPDFGLGGSSVTTQKKKRSCIPPIMRGKRKVASSVKAKFS